MALQFMRIFMFKDITPILQSLGHGDTNQKVSRTIIGQYVIIGGYNMVSSSFY